MSTLFYKLSVAADNDLSEIFDYTGENFGDYQAVKYITGFDVTFENLCKNPMSGRGRNEIKKDLRSISYESHIVFYRIHEDHILIVRILHASRDIIKFFPPRD